MPSQAELKKVATLKQRKFRQEYGLFVVEGHKMVRELVASSFTLQKIYSTAPEEDLDVALISKKEMEKISSLKTPPGLLAVAEIKKEPALDLLCDGPLLILEQLKDPGNLGTIIRTAHWFGFRNIVCTAGSVEFYNPKVLQATMGSFFHTHLAAAELSEILSLVQEKKYQVFAADLAGQNYATVEFPAQSALIIGNESHGLSDQARQACDVLLTIPQRGGGESLNAAMSCGILMGEMARKFN